MRCKNCNADFKEIGLIEVDVGCEITYRVGLDDNGKLKFEVLESDRGAWGSFRCPNCNEKVCFDDEEAIKLLKDE
jgi:DNA-directed RNA polymerase subunit RPC12/RpoP